MSCPTTDSPYVFEATGENFEALVLDNSVRGPVLVNCWSPTAESCRRLYPSLETLVRELDGRLLLANLNVDDEHALALAYGVTRVPTLMLFLDRAVVETVHGYRTQIELKRMMTSRLARESDGALAEALRVHAGGDPERAVAMLAEAATADPANLRIPLALAKLLIRDGNHAEAYRLLGALPEDMRETSGIRDLLAHLGFILAAAHAPESEQLRAAVDADGDDLEARYRLGARLLVADDYEGAMAQLLEIMRRDRDFRDDAGRKGLLAVFGILGDENPLVARFRSAMLEID